MTLIEALVWFGKRGGRVTSYESEAGRTILELECFDSGNYLHTRTDVTDVLDIHDPNTRHNVAVQHLLYRFADLLRMSKHEPGSLTLAVPTLAGPIYGTREVPID